MCDPIFMRRRCSSNESYLKTYFEGAPSTPQCTNCWLIDWRCLKIMPGQGSRWSPHSELRNSQGNVSPSSTNTQGCPRSQQDKSRKAEHSWSTVTADIMSQTFQTVHYKSNWCCCLSGYNNSIMTSINVLIYLGVYEALMKDRASVNGLNIICLDPWEI